VLLQPRHYVRNACDANNDDDDASGANDGDNPGEHTIVKMKMCKLQRSSM